MNAELVKHKPTEVERRNEPASMMEVIARAATCLRRKPTIDRFMRYVLPEPNSGCWLWIGGHKSGGYGQFNFSRGITRSAHLVSYALHIGEVPAGLQLDHLCRVRCCVNPKHLEPVTQQENVARGEAHLSASRYQSKKTHCPRGHEYTVANTYMSLGTRPHRECRECHRSYYPAKYKKVGVGQ